MQTDQLEVIKIITESVLFQKFTHITEDDAMSCTLSFLCWKWTFYEYFKNDSYSSMNSCKSFGYMLVHHHYPLQLKKMPYQVFAEKHILGMYLHNKA